MNDRYEHLLRKARDAKRGGHDSWTVQSTGEKVAVALVLNRADWLTQIGYTIPEAIERSGADSCSTAGCSPACRGGVMVMQTIPLHRLCQVSGIISAIVLALVLIGTATGRNTLVCIYLRSTEAANNATHIHGFLLDRIDPTCPQCM